MKTTHNGLTFYHEDHGAGTPVVLLHGFPLHHGIWRPQVTALREHWRIITPDLRGHGSSDAPPGVYTMDLLAEDVQALLEKLRCGPAVIAGHSMGGYIAFAFYRRYPQWVKGLILVSTRAGADTPEGRIGREALALQVAERGSAPVVQKMLPNMMAPASLTAHPGLEEEISNMIAGTPVSGLAGALRGLAARPEVYDLLPQLHLPVLIVAGTADALIPHSESEAMARAIPGAALHLISGVGHLPSREKPDEFTGVLRSWLRQSFA